MKALERILCVLAVSGMAAASLQAQQSVPVDTTRPRNEKPFSPADTVIAALRSKRLTPGRAFVRSLLIPGWGQFSNGAMVRGSIYASLQGASAFMLVKTQIKIGDARNEVKSLRKTAVDSLVADAQQRRDTAKIRRYANADSVTVVADGTFAVADKQSLVRARVRQREDWITDLIFFTLASGVDAFVGAHLSDFPGSVSAEPTPAGMRFRLDFRLGGRPGTRARPERVPHAP